MFSKGSRYENVPVAVFADATGREIAFKRLRRLPEPGLVRQHHTVQPGDRLDLLAYQYLGDPLLFWRLCDANRATRPDDLLRVPGRRLAISLETR